MSERAAFGAFVVDAISDVVSVASLLLVRTRLQEARNAPRQLLAEIREERG